MKTGTKSVLFGVHCPPIHSFFMCIAWLRCYMNYPEKLRMLFDPRLHLCFLLHDIGYWGCKAMDDEDGERHPELGAKIIGKLFGLRWYERCLFHSDSMVRIYNQESPRSNFQPSDLYPVDKLASALYPAWLYKLLSSWSREWIEYAQIHFDADEYVGTLYDKPTTHVFWREKPIAIHPEGRAIGKKSEYIEIKFEDWHIPVMKLMEKRVIEYLVSGSWQTMKEYTKGR